MPEQKIPRKEQESVNHSVVWRERGTIYTMGKYPNRYHWHFLGYIGGENKSSSEHVIKTRNREINQIKHIEYKPI